MSWNIQAGQSVSGMQAVFSPSFLPTAEAEQEKEGHDIVHTLLSNDQNCCIINTSSHTQNLGCSGGSYLYPSQIVCCQMYMKAQRPTFRS